ncbi:hypothetical protein D3C73_1290160 [compost metagenome]
MTMTQEEYRNDKNNGSDHVQRRIRQGYGGAYIGEYSQRDGCGGQYVFCVLGLVLDSRSGSLIE